MKPDGQKLWLRFSLTGKILVVFLVLLVVSLVIVGSLALVNLRGLGNYSLDSQESLGEQAVQDSTQALRAQAEEHLQRLAESQAAISNALFEEIKDEINIAGNYASQLWSGPTPATFPISYDINTEPADIYSASAYFVSSGATVSPDEINLSAWMDNIFIPTLSNNSNLLWIYIGTDSGLFRVYPWTSLPNNFDHTTRTWYQRAKSTGEAGWTEPYIDAATSGLVVTYSSPVYDDSDVFIGVIATDVTLNTVNENIINTQVGESGYAFLIDGDGNIIARPGLSTGDKGWDESFETENLLESDNQELRKIASEMTAGNTGIDTATFEEGERYVAYAPVTSTGWSIGIVMPIDEVIAPALATEQEITNAISEARSGIFDRIERTRNIFIFIFIGLIIAVIVIAYWLARTISRPVAALSASARIIGAGNLDHRVQVRDR